MPKPTPQSAPKSAVEENNLRRESDTHATDTAAAVIQDEVDFLEKLLLKEDGVEVDVGALREEIDVLRGLVGNR
ncbi:hypothetical protein A1F94_008088 [Pyrenophora tritici-repentis]|nr:hypothetical protein A1F94_008088 [Pyrenophora tritici-repentis]KAI1576676.1 hypothetical protein PtrEW4_001992 [Pyrenophora tritici-repentis]PZC99139.1 hypothetical protein A1F95_03711 [Pyrenophora tritici-repentis]PZD42074.1 hypothetical protein A1F97_03867 [Pyrenophora tritici-repentis]